ncbi:unnamed protein product [Closterium sp. NIES-53]
MEAGAKRPEDVSLPKATMSRLIKEMLPRDVRVSKDTQDLLMDCCLGGLPRWLYVSAWAGELRGRVSSVGG